MFDRSRPSSPETAAVLETAGAQRSSRDSVVRVPGRATVTWVPHGSRTVRRSPSSALCSQARRDRVEVVARGHGDRHIAQPQGGGARSRTAAVPRVHRDVVVVAAGGREERTRVGAQHRLEAQRVHVEVAGPRDVAHLQVDVADDARVVLRVGERLLGQVLLQVGVGVEEDRDHLDLTVGLVGPCGARAIAVELDAVALRVREVEGLAHQVIAGAHEPAGRVLRGAGDSCGQRGLVLEEEGGVEQAGLRVVDTGQARGLDEADEGDVAASQHAHDVAALAALLDGGEGQRVRVVRAHRLQVAHVQRDGAHGRGGVEGPVESGGGAHGDSRGSSCGDDSSVDS